MAVFEITIALDTLVDLAYLVGANIYFAHFSCVIFMLTSLVGLLLALVSAAVSRWLKR